MPIGLLVGEAKVFKHGKAGTLYVTIPSAIAQDSVFTIREGDTVKVEFDKEHEIVILTPKGKTEKRTRRNE